MEMMNAVLCPRYGSAEVLTWGQIGTPQISPQQLLIRVRASSVNPVDWKVREGQVRPFTGKRPPLVLGADLAGEVVAVGREVSGYAVGDKVYGMLPAFKGGAYAEFAAVSPEHIAPMPTNLSFSEAACLPLVALTIYQLLYDRAPVQPGQQILVNGCCGGLGHIAVQMAKALHCEVTGVCSTANLALAKRLGADQLIDYRVQDVLSTTSRFDLFFDAVANQHFAAVRPLLKSNGRYVSPIPTASNMLLAPLANLGRKQQHQYLWVRPDTNALRQISRLVEQGLLRPLIECSYPLEQIAAAHRHSESGRTLGKIALTC